MHCTVGSEGGWFPLGCEGGTHSTEHTHDRGRGGIKLKGPYALFKQAIKKSCRPYRFYDRFLHL